MEIGLEPKVNNIDVKPVGKKYEINFGDEVWIYLGGRKELTELRDKINDVLMGENYKSDMLREKQDYKDEVKLAGGKVD